MMQEAGLFLLDVVLQPFAAILMLRFHLQWLRAPMYNPVGEFVMVFTNFVVLRARRYIPSAWGFDTASLLPALLVEMLYLAAVGTLQGYAFHGVPLIGIALLAAVKLLKISVYLLMGAVAVQAVLSWVNPHSSLAPALAAVTRRFLQPLRRIVPTVGNIDLSGMVLFILCQLVIIVPIGVLEQFAARLI